MIGEYSSELCAIAKATGGYAFQPSRLKDGLKLCELETLLRCQERAPTPSPPPSEWEWQPALPLTFSFSSSSLYRELEGWGGLPDSLTFCRLDCSCQRI